MSETVGYKGKLKLCKKYKDANELQANLQKFWQSRRAAHQGECPSLQETNDMCSQRSRQSRTKRRYSLAYPSWCNEIPSNHYGVLRDA